MKIYNTQARRRNCNEKSVYGKVVNMKEENIDWLMNYNCYSSACVCLGLVYILVGHEDIYNKEYQLIVRTTVNVSSV